MACLPLDHGFLREPDVFSPGGVRLGAGLKLLGRTLTLVLLLMALVGCLGPVSLHFHLSDKHYYGSPGSTPEDVEDAQRGTAPEETIRSIFDVQET